MNNGVIVGIVRVWEMDVWNCTLTTSALTALSRKRRPSDNRKESQMTLTILEKEAGLSKKEFGGTVIEVSWA